MSNFLWPPWTVAPQASLPLTICQSLLELMSIESVMLSNHLILYRPLLLPSIFASIRVFSNESALHIRWPEYWGFSFSTSPSNEYSGLISFRIDWFDLPAVESEVAQLCPILGDPTDCNLPAPLSMGFSRQEYWSGLLFPSPGHLPSPGIEPRSPHCGQMLYHLSHQGSPAVQRDSQKTPTPQIRGINSLALSPLYGPTFTFVCDYCKNHSFDYTSFCQQRNVSAFLICCLGLSELFSQGASIF